MAQSLLKFVRTIQTRDVRWTDKWLSRTILHPGYWVRRRLHRAIASTASLASGCFLDVGCGLKPYEMVFGPFVERYFGLEYSPDSGFRGNRADFYGDACDLPLRTGGVDTILCTEVLEHLADPERAIAEFARILRPGGTLITTAPFVFPIHDTHDYFRYSPDGLAAIMKRHGLIVDEIRPLSGTGITLAAMLNLYLFDIGFLWTRWMYPIGLVFRPLIWLSCSLINIVGGLLDLVLPSNHLSFNHLTIARKPDVNL